MKNQPSIRNNGPRTFAAILPCLLIALALAVGPASSASADEQEPEGSIRVTVNGIVCAFCVQGVERHFRTRDEVKRMFISLEHSVLLLELKPEIELTDEAITETTKRAGYEVRAIERLEIPFEEERKRLREQRRDS